MGKAARNEMRKQTASLYNNLSAGLLLAMVLIPYFTFITKLPDLYPWLTAWREGAATISGVEVGRAIIVILTTVVALCGVITFQEIARDQITEIED